MAKLVIFDSEGRREVELKSFNKVGRLPQNDVQILDRIVSKEHAVIEISEGDGFVVSDLGSLNGTYVNRQKIVGKQPLGDGDEITLGNTRCMFLNENATDNAGQVVDVSEGALQSHIRSAIEVNDRFLPEKEMTEEKQVREDYEKLRVTYEMQRDFRPDLELEEVLQKILERTFEFLNCDRGAILLTDESGEMKPIVYKMKKKEDKLVISSTLVNHVKAEKKGVLSSDAQMDTRFKEAKSMIMQGIRSSMAAPILHQDELLGCIVIDSSVAVNAYSEKDLQLLTNIGTQTARFISNVTMGQKIKEDAVTRERFSKLMSPDLAELVVSGKLSVEKGGQNRVATVLFADIRGFTSMSENMKAADVLSMLNEYFELMVEIAFKNEGTVDKFVGDEIMVLWGAPVSHNDDATRAVRAAVDMQRALIEFNKVRESEGQRSIHIGIGLNTGELVAGYIGSTRTMSYSVIGDVVNTAARLCSAAKAGQVIVSEDTYSKLNAEFECIELEDVRAKGKSKPIKVYNVVGYKHTGATDKTTPFQVPTTTIGK
ncbi:MAG: FHA domain-containing protein [Deltaproteobacteria bacterium]|nr:FHA domain-containing protein [Deltaproteobacteria bacterium]MBN2673637.1 FHA domain-containing protein [Deltaproteobacteria bacterium]